MQIVEVSVKEAAYIALLARFTFTETFGHYFKDKIDLENYLQQTFNVKKLRNSLTKPNNVFWLAYIDDLPVGYGKLKLNSPSNLIANENVCQLQKIYVLKVFLPKKEGLALQTKMFEREISGSAKKIWLSV